MTTNENSVPQVRVGIMTEPRVAFTLHGDYRVNGVIVSGKHEVTMTDGRVGWENNTFAQLLFEPVDASVASFTLHDVTIGVSFHWKRREDQTFKGALQFIVEHGMVTAINILPVEDYLLSVISSEMSATASLELLKAHAVISRSWLLAQMEAHEQADPDRALSTDYLAPTLGEAQQADDAEIIKWWDHDDHVNFDVCADDHCQRYQGITRAGTEAVRQAIVATWGEVLSKDGALCDARFSKSCGGVMEEFENCWEPVHHDYLVARRDGENETDFPDLTREDNAEEWILTAPKAFCNTHDKEILSQVLNDYDQETTDFYRWRVEYTQEQIAELIARRTGTDYGRIRDLQPVERGTSGRLCKMKIVGERCSRVIGKELAIRYALSESALYSSAFVVERHDIDSDGYPSKFVLRGAGWGHGVGLCQIGAAVMGAKGYDYRQILHHYFVDADIERRY